MACWVSLEWLRRSEWLVLIYQTSQLAELTPHSEKFLVARIQKFCKVLMP